MGLSATPESNRIKSAARTIPALLLALGFSAALVPQARAATVTTLYTFGTKPGESPDSLVTIFRGALYGDLASAKVYRLSLKRDKLHVVFEGAVTTHYYSTGPLVELNGSLYNFGINQAGISTIFRIDPLTHTASILYTFPGTEFVSNPGDNLAALNGKLYGTVITLKGRKQVGTVFSFDPANGTYTTLHTQTNEEGYSVSGGLTNHDGILYGAAAAHGHWNLFTFDPTTGAETIIHRFGADSQVPGLPVMGQLLFHGNELFGFTQDSTTGAVFIYRANIKTGGASLLHTFDMGEYVNESLVLQNGLLYGTIGSSNANPDGTVYTVDPKSGVLTTVYAFTNGTDGATPQAGLTLANGVLYGTTYESQGQSDRGGTIFKLTP